MDQAASDGNHEDGPKLQLLVTLMAKEGRMKASLAACEGLRPSVLEEKGRQAYEYMRDIPSAFKNQSQPIG